MGKASSAKKVARAAGLGGSRAYGARPPWGFYFAVVLLVVLGLLGVYNSREYRNAKINSQGSVAPTVKMTTPWFEGYAVEVCGKLLPPIKTNQDPYGITTKGDGIIYINPTVKSAAGHNATLGKFASAVGMTLNAAQLQVPGGKLYQAGDTCEGKPGQVYVTTWSSPAAPPQDGVLQNKNQISTATGYEDTCNPDCNAGVLLEKDQLVTIAFLPAPPKGHAPNVLQPPQRIVTRLSNLVATGGTTTTVPPTSAPTTTTAKGTGTSTKTSTATTSLPAKTSTTRAGTATSAGTSSTGAATTKTTAKTK